VRAIAAWSRMLSLRFIEQAVLCSAISRSNCSLALASAIEVMSPRFRPAAARSPCTFTMDVRCPLVLHGRNRKPMGQLPSDRSSHEAYGSRRSRSAVQEFDDRLVAACAGAIERATEPSESVTV
jgi:hypothetical protein